MVVKVRMVARRACVQLFQSWSDLLMVILVLGASWLDYCRALWAMSLDPWGRSRSFHLCKLQQANRTLKELSACEYDLSEVCLLYKITCFSQAFSGWAVILTFNCFFFILLIVLSSLWRLYTDSSHWFCLHRDKIKLKHFSHSFTRGQKSTAALHNCGLSLLKWACER